MDSFSGSKTSKGERKNCEQESPPPAVTTLKPAIYTMKTVALQHIAGSNWHCCGHPFLPYQHGSYSDCGEHESHDARHRWITSFTNIPGALASVANQCIVRRSVLLGFCGISCRMFLLVCCMCMAACLYVCMYVCMYVCTSVRRYVRMYVSMSLCMHAWMYVCMYVSMSVSMYVCMYVCMYVRTYVCMYVCMYVYCMYVGTCIRI